MAADFIKEKKTRRLATKAAIAMGVLILLVVGLNAGLTAAIVFLAKDVRVATDGSLRGQKTDDVSVSTHTQKNVYVVKLGPSQRRLDEPGSGVNVASVAQVACGDVMKAIASIEHGDDTGLVKLDFGNGDISLPSMSGANYYMKDDSFGMEQVFLSRDPDVSYDVSCETTKAACTTNPSFCDVVLSAATPSTRRALSFEEAFDGDQKVSRRRLTTTKLTSAEILGEVYQNSTNLTNSTSGDSLNTVDGPCALVPNSSQGGVAKLCKDLLGVGLDDSIYCGQEVLQETEKAPLGSASPEPSFTMREVLASADTEQTYNAVVDRCQPTTARRQMWNLRENYGWCSIAAGFVAARASSGVIGHEDSANYCDASTSEASQGKGSQTSGCCVEHDKCLTCERRDRSCTGSSSTGGNCDRELSTCAWAVSCSTQTTYSVWSWSWRRGWYQVTRTIRGYDFTCAAVSTVIASAMGNPVRLPNGGKTCQTG